MQDSLPLNIKKTRMPSQAPHERVSASTGHTICRHNKRKTRCHQCNGGSVCPHDKIRIHCQLCKGEDALIRNWTSSAKSADKVSGVGTTSLSKKALRNVIRRSGRRCYYCGKRLSLSHRKASIMSLERIDSNKPHSDTNSRVSCLTCNTTRVNERGKLK